ncbi:MAG: alanine racemase C-terminal domain-containing protein [Armatimonadota bacterium]|nr:alanine racemase C-terminal domain-containing protein [Armatimonadota bacterium]
MRTGSPRTEQRGDDAGRRHPPPRAGRVCVDYTMLDVSGAPVREGDEVTVFGPGLGADQVAQAAGTVPYELSGRVSRRVPRIYLCDGRPVAIAATVPAAVRPTGIEVR